MRWRSLRPIWPVAKFRLFIIRAFVNTREDHAANVAILKRLAEIDKTLLTHDTALRVSTRNFARYWRPRLGRRNPKSDSTSKKMPSRIASSGNPSARHERVGGSCISGVSHAPGLECDQKRAVD